MYVFDTTMQHTYHNDKQGHLFLISWFRNPTNEKQSCRPIEKMTIDTYLLFLPLQD